MEGLTSGVHDSAMSSSRETATGPASERRALPCAPESTTSWYIASARESCLPLVGPSTIDTSVWAGLWWDIGYGPAAAHGFARGNAAPPATAEPGIRQASASSASTPGLVVFEEAVSIGYTTLAGRPGSDGARRRAASGSGSVTGGAWGRNYTLCRRFSSR